MTGSILNLDLSKLVVKPNRSLRTPLTRWNDLPREIGFGSLAEGEDPKYVVICKVSCSSTVVINEVPFFRDLILAFNFVPSIPTSLSDQYDTSST